MLRVAMMVIVFACGSGCTLVGGITGLIVTSGASAPQPAPRIVQPPPRKTLEARDRARCEIERDVQASAAASDADAGRRRMLIATLPNCLDPYWDTPGYKLEPARAPAKPIVREQENQLIGLAAGMAIGLAVDLLILAAAVAGAR